MSKQKKLTVQQFLNDVNEKKGTFINQKKRVFKEDKRRSHHNGGLLGGKDMSNGSRTSSTQSEERERLMQHEVNGFNNMNEAQK